MIRKLTSLVLIVFVVCVIVGVSGRSVAPAEVTVVNDGSITELGAPQSWQIERICIDTSVYNIEFEVEGDILIIELIPKCEPIEVTPQPYTEESA